MDRLTSSGHGRAQAGILLPVICSRPAGPEPGMPQQVFLMALSQARIECSNSVRWQRQEK